MTDTILNTSAQFIGETQYLTADKVDLDDCIRAGLLNERSIELLQRATHIVEATPESFRVAVARRPLGAPWPPRGFTQAYLEERGFIDQGFEPGQPEEPTPEPQPKPSRAKASKEPQATPDFVTLTPDAVEVGPYFLQPSKRGNFKFWTAAAADGRILRAALFKSEAAGREFLATLSTDAAPADTQEEEALPETAADDEDVRSDAGDGEGPGSPEDR